MGCVIALRYALKPANTHSVELPTPNNNIDTDHIDAGIYLVKAAIGYVLVSKLYHMIFRLAEP